MYAFLQIITTLGCIGLFVFGASIEKQKDLILNLF